MCCCYHSTYCLLKSCGCDKLYNSDDNEQDSVEIKVLIDNIYFPEHTGGATE